MVLRDSHFGKDKGMEFHCQWAGLCLLSWGEGGGSGTRERSECGQGRG